MSTVLSQSRASAARSEALAWVRFMLNEPRFDPVRFEIDSWQRNVVRLAEDAWIAWCMEFPDMQPARWRAPYLVFNEGRELGEKNQWAAPLCINAALRILRQLPDAPKPRQGATE